MQNYEKKSFGKRKTCPWMTAGSLNSIYEKHPLYRLSLLSPEYKNYYLCYKKIFRTNIRLAMSNNYNSKLSIT